MTITKSLGSIPHESMVAGLGDTYRELSPWLRQRLRHRMSNASDVDDVVQESFVRLSRYDTASRNRHPRALLLRIAGNLVIDGNRRSQARGGDAQTDLESAAFDRNLASEPDQEALLAIKQAVLNLPPPLRAVFSLARFTPMSHAEIAKSLGISIKTVEWRLAKAISMCLDDLRP